MKQTSEWSTTSDTLVTDRITTTMAPSVATTASTTQPAVTSSALPTAPTTATTGTIKDLLFSTTTTTTTTTATATTMTTTMTTPVVTAATDNGSGSGELLTTVAGATGDTDDEPLGPVLITTTLPSEKGTGGETDTTNEGTSAEEQAAREAAAKLKDQLDEAQVAVDTACANGTATTACTQAKDVVAKKKVEFETATAKADKIAAERAAETKAGGSDDDSDMTGVIVAIVIILLLCVAIGVALFVYKREKDNKDALLESQQNRSNTHDNPVYEATPVQRPAAGAEDELYKDVAPEPQVASQLGSSEKAFTLGGTHNTGGYSVPMGSDGSDATYGEIAEPVDNPMYTAGDNMRSRTQSNYQGFDGGNTEA